VIRDGHCSLSLLIYLNNIRKKINLNKIDKNWDLFEKK